MASPRVSIVTLTYGHAKYIGRCIESVLAQTRPDWELLIVDDASPDATAEVVARYKDPRIKYLPQAHRGIGGMQHFSNLALAQAKGEFVAILEGDDFWPADKLEKSLEAFDAPDVVLVYGVTQMTSSGGRPLESFIPSRELRAAFPRGDFDNEPLGRAARGILLSHRLWTCSVSSVIRRSALDELGGFRSISNGALIDRPTFLELSLIGRFRFVDRVAGYWRQYGHNSSANVGLWKEMAEGILEFNRRFLRENASRLGMDREEQARVLRYWTSNIATSGIGHGRSLLLEKRWAQARREFAAALRGVDRPGHAFSAAVGWLASWVHTDVEALYRLAGRPSGIELFRRREAAGSGGAASS